MKKISTEILDVVYEVIFHFFQALEKFLYEAMSLLSKLEEIQEGLSKNEIAETLDGLKDQIKKNQHVKKWIVKAPVEVLQQEGDKILDFIRNPGNGEASEGFSTEDFKSAEQQVKGLIENLHGKRQKLPWIMEYSENAAGSEFPVQVVWARCRKGKWCWWLTHITPDVSIHVFTFRRSIQACNIYHLEILIGPYENVLKSSALMTLWPQYSKALFSLIFLV